MKKQLKKQTPRYPRYGQYQGLRAIAGSTGLSIAAISCVVSCSSSAPLVNKSHIVDTGKDDTVDPVNAIFGEDPMPGMELSEEFPAGLYQFQYPRSNYIPFVLKDETKIQFTLNFLTTDDSAQMKIIANDKIIVEFVLSEIEKECSSEDDLDTFSDPNFITHINTQLKTMLEWWGDTTMRIEAHKP